MGGSGLAGRPCCCCCCWGAASPPGGAYVYEGGRPRGFWGFMGSEALLSLEACGDSDVGRCWPVGVLLPWGEGEGLCEELLRFEPTRFLKRAFMEFMCRGEKKAGGPGGVRAPGYCALQAAAADARAGHRPN